MFRVARGILSTMSPLLRVMSKNVLARPPVLDEGPRYSATCHLSRFLEGAQALPPSGCPEQSCGR